MGYKLQAVFVDLKRGFGVSKKNFEDNINSGSWRENPGQTKAKRLALSEKMYLIL